jgi:hypothetical protein
LNGWKRIGIILSVLWVVIGGFWTRGIIIDDLGRLASGNYRLCADMHAQGVVPFRDTDCTKQFQAEWARDVTNEQINERAGGIAALAKPGVRCLILSEHEGGNMKPAAAMILVAGLSTTAQAVETGTLTLACKGTIVAGYEGAKPDPISMGLIVSFTAGTVQGFGDPGLLDVPIKITGINEVTVSFRGSARVLDSDWSMSGSIDRVTGDVDASQISTDPKTGKMITSSGYSLKCRPTQRMF